MDFDYKFPTTVPPESVFLSLMRGTLPKPTVEQIMHVYSQEFMPLIEVARSTLGCPPGKELDYIKIAINYIDVSKTLDHIRLNIPSNKSDRYPDKWQLGDIVRFITDNEYGWRKGEFGIINTLAPKYSNRRADEYQVFWTHILDSNGNFSKTGGSYWTTPDDVIFVKRSNLI